MRIQNFIDSNLDRRLTDNFLQQPTDDGDDNGVKQLSIDNNTIEVPKVKKNKNKSDMQISVSPHLNKLKHEQLPKLKKTETNMHNNGCSERDKDMYGKDSTLKSPDKISMN